MQIISGCCELYWLEHSIQLDDQTSSSRKLWELVMSALTHPAVRVLQGNLSRAGFCGICASSVRYVH